MSSKHVRNFLRTPPNSHRPFLKKHSIAIEIRRQENHSNHDHSQRCSPKENGVSLIGVSAFFFFAAALKQKPSGGGPE